MAEIIVRALSDTHGFLPEIEPCDILLIGGDVCPVFDHDERFQWLWLRGNFADWLENLPAKHIVGIGGNHDFILENDPTTGYELPWIYLCDEETEVMGLKIYGSPWVPNLPAWAFHLSNGELAKSWDKIPDDTDILMTHGPPFGWGDKVRYKRWETSNHVGSSSLTQALPRIRPKLHVFGHIHEDRGIWHIDERTLANVSMVDANYERGTREPMEFKLGG